MDVEEGEIVCDDIGTCKLNIYIFKLKRLLINIELLRCGCIRQYS